jgi:hypothetical protein
VFAPLPPPVELIVIEFATPFVVNVIFEPGTRVKGELGIFE